MSNRVAFLIPTPATKGTRRAAKSKRASRARLILYWVALTDADVPAVRFGGKGTKNKRAAEQPVPPLLAARLRAYLAGRPADQPVWPGTWAERSADIFKDDLAEAGVPAPSPEGTRCSTRCGTPTRRCWPGPPR